MIRIETPDGWWLIGHRDHARLAAAFARHWCTAAFPAPEPRDEVLLAVAAHDDAWVERDRLPELTAEGRPSAFTRELVGTYDAFEEIDFYAYLKVRGAATETHAEAHPYAAMLISMHTVSLLTLGADLSTLDAAEQAFHAAFIAGQKRRQAELLAEAVARDPALAPYATPEACQRAFEYLQACDSFSLIGCVGYDRPLALQHRHPTATGERVAIEMQPLGVNRYRLAPYPLDRDEVVLTVPARFVPGRVFRSLEHFRATFDDAPLESLAITLSA